MIKKILKKYFSLLTNLSLINVNSLSKIIKNPSLIKEILLMNEFKQKWRNSLDYIIINEKYKITDLKIIKDFSGIKVITKVIHSFKINDYLNDKTSKEILKYIFFLKKDKLTWNIIDLYNEELFPKLYSKVIENKFNYFDKNNNSISLLRDSLKIDFWQNKINNIDTLIECYSHNTIYNFQRNKSSKFNKEMAVNYSRKYALNYNNLYKNFSNIGGDCTNFVSQCLTVGGIPTSKTWKPYSNSWIRVIDLYDYLINNNYGYNHNINIKFEPGDIIQFFSNKKGTFSHSGIISKALYNGDYLYCCHSYDKLDFPLSEVFPILYNKFRIISITY